MAVFAEPLLEDADPEVRVEAALAQDSDAAITKDLLAALEVGPDPRLVHQLGLHLGRRADPDSVLSLLHSTNTIRRHAGLVALDVARSERHPLASKIAEIAPHILKEVPPGLFSQKLTWLLQRQPEKLAAEISRLDNDELHLPAQEISAVLQFLEANPRVRAPRSFLRKALQHPEPGVQESALRALRQCGPPDQSFYTLVHHILHSTKVASVRLEAIFTLPVFGSSVPTGEWLRALDLPHEQAPIATLRALREVESSPDLTKALLELAPALLARQPRLQEDIVLTLQALGVGGEECKAVATPNPVPDHEDRAAQVLAILPQASPLLGRFSFHSPRAACATCHKTDAAAPVAFGPNLAQIAAASQPDYLLESILTPSKIIKTGFQAEQVETTDGQTFSGLIDLQHGILMVKTSPSETARLPLATVTRRTASALSSMPTGLEASMSTAELADLLAYLASLK